MENFITFLEKTMVNKFNIHWQIIRTKARSIKDFNEKISYVKKFLNEHPNKNNFGRVLNWVKMTGVAYPAGSKAQQAFIDAENDLKSNQEKYTSEDDNSNDLGKITTDDLNLVYKDLKKRKYGFQYKSVPKAHIEFVERLEQELNKRKQP